MEAEDGRQTSNEANEVSGSINHGRMSITEEEDEVGEDLSEEDDISNEDLSEGSEDEDYDIYYGGDNEDLDDGRAGCHGVGPGSQFNNNDDPEYFAYECLTVAQVKDLLTENISKVCSSVQVSHIFIQILWKSRCQ